MNSLPALPEKLLRPVDNRDGATLVFFALTIFVLLGCMALAVDVGSALNARSEAQRAADSAALAGAGLFMSLAPGLTPAQISPLAEDTAMRFAEFNQVGWNGIDSVNVDVTVWEADQRVGVEITGTAPLFFAPFLGVVSMPVSAYAEARVQGAGSASCVKPFAMPDMWLSGQTGTPVYNETEDHLWGPYDETQGDRYEAWNGTLTHNTATGFGAPVRNGVTNWQGNSYQHDSGRKILFKRGSHDAASGSVEVPVVTTPSNHYLLDLGDDTTPIPGIACNGGPTKEDICRCNNRVVSIGDELSEKPGNTAGPARQGVEALINAAPDHQWVSTNGGQVVDSNGNVITNSPRIIKTILYDPRLELGPGRDEIVVTNIALMFLESFEGNGNNVNVSGRFLAYASGSGSGAGVLVKSLQLVK